MEQEPRDKKEDDGCCFTVSIVDAADRWRAGVEESRARSFTIADTGVGVSSGTSISQAKLDQALLGHSCELERRFTDDWIQVARGRHGHEASFDASSHISSVTESWSVTECYHDVPGQNLELLNKTRSQTDSHVHPYAIGTQR